jgi:hypothetical protein
MSAASGEGLAMDAEIQMKHSNKTKYLVFKLITGFNI